VSPRYAVTAGHCVDDDSVADLARDLVTVQMYRFPAGYDWLNASTLSGAYPISRTRPSPGIRRTSSGSPVDRPVQAPTDRPAGADP
jgi:hypothetical protein